MFILTKNLKERIIQTHTIKIPKIKTKRESLTWGINKKIKNW